MSRPEALVFDLFGTLVFFDDARLPTVEREGRAVPTTLVGLEGLLRNVAPGVPVRDFVHALKSVGMDMLRERQESDVEYPTALRFERALRACDVAAPRAAEASRILATRHMETLFSAVVCPDDRQGLLASLKSEFRLALLSNFDDGPTARRILAASGLDEWFEVIVVSAEEGVRKPSASIFAKTCSLLGVAPERSLYVGDTFVDDIRGATGAGLAALWITTGEASEPAVGAITDVRELPAWLAGRAATSTRGI